MTGEIYKITCNVNGKVYIGQTTIGYKHRWKQHGMNDTLISRAIRKHGKQTFNIEVIHVTEFTEELDELEIYYIKYYNSIIPNGYNVKTGGKQYNCTNSVESIKTPIIVWNSDNNIELEFKSYHDASRELEFHVGSIRRSCKNGYIIGIRNEIKYYARHLSEPKVIKPRKIDKRKKFTPQQCEHIMFFYNLCIFDQYDLAEYYDTSQPLIHKVLKSSYYGDKKEIKERLNITERENIKFFYNLGIFNKTQLEKYYNTSIRTVRRIINGK